MRCPKCGYEFDADEEKINTLFYPGIQLSEKK